MIQYAIVRNYMCAGPLSTSNRRYQPFRCPPNQAVPDAKIKSFASTQRQQRLPLSDIPPLAHRAQMTVARPFLIDMLRRIANGGTIDHAQLDAGVGDPSSLDRDEKNAWQELSHWADDDDIRERDEQYAAFKRERMRDHIATLNIGVDSDKGVQPITAKDRGCAVTLACFNVAAMGLLASSFAFGPFSSAGQDFWYRYGSIGFLLLGAIMPTGALVFGARRYAAMTKGATVWMFAIWLPFAGYLLMSGGGM